MNINRYEIFHLTSPPSIPNNLRERNIKVIPKQKVIRHLHFFRMKQTTVKIIKVTIKR